MEYARNHKEMQDTIKMIKKAILYKEGMSQEWKVKKNLDIDRMINSLRDNNFMED